MIAMTVTENNGGIMFGSRRCSMDKNLNEFIHDFASGNSIFGTPYTAMMLDECKPMRTLDDCGEDDVLFIENVIPDLTDSRITMFVLFQWNRDYPSTLKFEFDRTGWRRIFKTSIDGNSHDEIGMEVYVR